MRSKKLLKKEVETGDVYMIVGLGCVYVVRMYGSAIKLS